MQTANAAALTPRHPWVVLSLLEWSSAYLSERGFDEARLNAELLLAHVLSLSRLDLYLQFDRPLGTTELEHFKVLFKRRLTHEPIQYILGETEFMGLRLFVDKSVLVPRPETEALVERTLETIKECVPGSITILDIGTGSGNIAIALAHFSPSATVTSIDVSPAALAVAQRNVTRHGLNNILLEEADVFADPPVQGLFDILVSNPPYISSDEFPFLQVEVRDYEPRLAATDEGDGLRFIRRICELGPRLLKAGGALLMEIGWEQSGHARRFAETSGLTCVEFFKDFAGITRVLKARPPGSVPYARER